MAVHAVQFIRKNGWWGLCSEQCIESFHAIFNTDLARRRNTKDDEIILRFCAAQQMIRNYLFDRNLY